MAEPEQPERSERQKRRRVVAGVLQRLRATAPSPAGWLSAGGLASAAFLAVAVNVWGARHFIRADWTSERLYTLSPATVETLEALPGETEVVVLLGRADPLALTVRHMLAAYEARSNRLVVRWVDPEREPGELLVQQKRFDVLSGRTQDGRTIADAAIVVARGDQHWFIGSDDLVALDPESGKSRPRLEIALTEALRNVGERRRSKLCLSVGHEEPSLIDVGPRGLGELKRRLEKNNHELEELALEHGDAERTLRGCTAVIVAGPETPFSAPAAERLVRYVRGGGSAFLLVGPLMDVERRLVPTGLEPVMRLAGYEPSVDFVVERAASERLPTGLGELFFARPEPHATTRLLVRSDGAHVEHRVLLATAQSFQRIGTESVGVKLLSTTAEAVSLRDVRPFLDGGAIPTDLPKERRGPLVVGAAAELAKVEPNAPHGPRLVLVGASTPVEARAFRDPALIGDRLLAESAIAWLTAQPLMVSVPERPEKDAGLSLTEESLTQLWRYCLLYLPLASALLGGMVLYGRHRQERASRRARTEAGE